MRKRSRLDAGALWAVLKQTFSEWSADNVPTLGAALAYYTVFSLAPLLVISIALTGLIFGEDVAQGRVLEQVRGLIGNEAGAAIEEMVENAGARGSEGIIASVAGVAALLLGASGVFGQLQTSLNLIWGVKPKAGRGLLGAIHDRFLSFGFILVVGFLLLVSLLLSAAISFASQWMGEISAATEIVGQVLNAILSLAVISLLFAMIFKFLPDAKIAWRDVWPGAIVTAALFTLGKTVLGIYLGRSSVASAYGAAGSLVILLLWVFYSAQILFFGAEFTQVWANRFGSKVVPEADARPAERNG